MNPSFPPAAETWARTVVLPVLVLQIAAGLILFLVALRAVMQQYDVTYPPDRTEPPLWRSLSPHSHFRPS